MSVIDAAATTLDTATLARFVRDGYLTVQTSLPPSFHVDVLDAALRAPGGPARRHAAHALSEMGAAAVELLVERARDADEQVAINAIDALGNMGAAAEPAEPALRAALKADNPWVRRHATEALGILGSSARSAVADLADALCDEQPYVRFNAATALARMGPPARRRPPWSRRSRIPIATREAGLCKHCSASAFPRH